MPENIHNFALLGYPVGHSRSQEIHHEFLRQAKLKGAYVLVSTPPDRLTTTLGCLRELEFSGCNLTIPLKRSGFDRADRTSEAARFIGAINTLCFLASGELYGENTDWLGFLQSLPKQLVPRKIGIVGAGGSARAVVAALDHGCRQQVEEIIFFARTPSKAEEIVAGLDWCRTRITSFRESPKLKLDLLVNTTPLGMAGHAPGQCPIPEELEVGDSCYVYDLIYSPSQTPLLEWAARKDLQSQGGWRMLQLQAAHSFSLWTGVPVEELKVA